MKIYTRLTLSVLVVVLVAWPSRAQEARTVTLMLNTATNPDTTSIMDNIQVRGAVKGTAPATLTDGNVIDWTDASTLRPKNVGGDYWHLEFQIADTTELTFKFFSTQTQTNGGNGWEADPNPVIPPGTGDTTLALHYFESQGEWHGVSGDRGEYDWRPFESREDSVAVWFRVAMFGMESEMDGYNASLSSEMQVVGVRGDDLSMAGPLDWGSSFALNRESSAENSAGHNIYSGVAYFAESLVGTAQNYKFVVENLEGDEPVVGWEEGNVEGNRNFVIPAQDTTLHWVFFGDTAPSAVDPVTSNIVFGVDLTPFETIGLFDRARGDTLWVLGGFNSWQNCITETPDRCLMEKEPGGTTFGAAVPIMALPGTEQSYKYFFDFNDAAFEEAFGQQPPSGWEEAHLTGINRRFTFEASEQQLLPLSYFNDVTPKNVMEAGTVIALSFSVDMANALTNDAQPFDPSMDTVSVHLGDPIWAHTQGIDGTDHSIPLIDILQMTDEDGDGVFSGVVPVRGPSYNIVTFRFMYGRDGTYVQESGSDTNAPGRNRVYFIPRNADGSWPATVQLEQMSFKVEPGPLPYDTNPFITSVEEVAGEIPDGIWLGSNYPNPFNPTTTFEYSLSATSPVTVRVFDTLGRLVATLVDGVQQAATYQVTFDASQLSSGVYFYRLETPTRSLVQRMLLVK